VAGEIEIVCRHQADSNAKHEAGKLFNIVIQMEWLVLLVKLII
jgi:hypothetical protein